MGKSTKKKKAKTKTASPRVRNKKARFDFDILEVVEGGLTLVGSEVKSLRDGKANIDEAFARVREGEVWLYNMHIGPYSQAGARGHDTRRTRKLLLHRRQIDVLMGKTQAKGMTLVPLSVYFKRGWAKVELGVAKGKREFDKRETIKTREHKREMARAMALRGRR
ncbi:MAG: SsrA-binding protein SmpB [Planctomycetia bacterium]|nr:SsrA-binding protein SmpB [Planctomycetia bacterium]